MFTSSASKSVVALQWRLLVSSGGTIAERGVTAGNAAEKAHKSLMCAAERARSREASEYICVLAGGAEPLADGALALILVKIDAGTAPVKVEVRDVLGANGEATRVPIADAAATLTVR